MNKLRQLVVNFPLKIGVFFYGLGSGLVFGLAAEFLARLLTALPSKGVSLMVLCIGPLGLGVAGGLLLVAAGRLEARRQAIEDLINEEPTEEDYARGKRNIDEGYSRQIWGWILGTGLVVVLGALFTLYGYAEQKSYILACSSEVSQYLLPVEEPWFVPWGTELPRRVVRTPDHLRALLQGHGTAYIVAANPALVAQARETNPDLRIVGSAFAGREGSAVLVVQVGSGIESLHDLENRKVGVSSMTETSTILLREVLVQHFGLAYESASWITIPPQDLIQSLRLGNIDAALVQSWEIANPSELEGLVVLWDACNDSKRMLGDHPLFVVLAAPHSYFFDTRVIKVGARSMASETTDNVMITLTSTQELPVDLMGPRPTGVRFTYTDRSQLMLLLTFAYRQGLLEYAPEEDIIYEEP